MSLPSACASVFEDWPLSSASCVLAVFGDCGLAPSGLLLPVTAESPHQSAMRPARTLASERIWLSSRVGNCGLIVSSCSTIAPATTRRVNHLLSAGAITQGAYSVA